jgi:hypothetical protein
MATRPRRAHERSPLFSPLNRSESAAQHPATPFRVDHEAAEDVRRRFARAFEPRCRPRGRQACAAPRRRRVMCPDSGRVEPWPEDPLRVSFGHRAAAVGDLPATRGKISRPRSAPAPAARTGLPDWQARVHRRTRGSRPIDGLPTGRAAHSAERATASGGWWRSAWPLATGGPSFDPREGIGRLLRG